MKQFLNSNKFNNKNVLSSLIRKNHFRITEAYNKIEQLEYRIVELENQIKNLMLNLNNKL